MIALISLIAITYTCAVLAGRYSRQMGLQKYVGRLKELNRLHRRYSAFWAGLYGQLWVAAMEFCADLAYELMRLKPSKLPYFQKGLCAMSPIQFAL